MTFVYHILIAGLFFSAVHAMKRDVNGQEAWMSKLSYIKDGHHMLVLRNNVKEVIITYNKFLGNGSGIVYFWSQNEPVPLTPAQAHAYLKASGYKLKPYFNIRDI